MSNQRGLQRRREIEDLRDAGAEAFHAGRSLHNNPHRNLNERHWRQGWQEAEAAAAPPTLEERVELLEDLVLVLSNRLNRLVAEDVL